MKFFCWRTGCRCVLFDPSSWHSSFNWDYCHFNPLSISQVSDCGLLGNASRDSHPSSALFPVTPTGPKSQELKTIHEIPSRIFGSKPNTRELCRTRSGNLDFPFVKTGNFFQSVYKIFPSLKCFKTHRGFNVDANCKNSGIYLLNSHSTLHVHGSLQSKRHLR